MKQLSGEMSVVPSRIKSMPNRLFKEFSEFIESRLGIKMPPSKKTMLESRLQKRIRQLGLDSYEDYYNHVFNGHDSNDELILMINMVTTNKTDFFREPAHFDYLLNNALPVLLEMQKSHCKRLRIWSAGCSTGEEPYTMAMVLSEVSRELAGFSFSILATDISTKVLNHGIQGIYSMDKVEPIPLNLKKRYLLRSRDKKKNLARVVPALRQKVQFRRLNLMDSDFGIRDPLDVIFCRNVIIYFDRPTQEKLLNNFYRNLIPGGYVFMGHSETLNGLRVPLVQVAPTIYRRMQ